VDASEDGGITPQLAKGGENMLRIPRSTSGRLAFGAVVGLAVAYLLTTLAAGNTLNTFVLLFEVVLLGLAILITMRRWWAYALAAAVSGLLFLFTLAGAIDRFSDPGDPVAVGIAIFLALALIAIVAGLWSAVQAARRTGTQG
jgi:hypothetical protein